MKDYSALAARIKAQRDSQREQLAQAAALATQNETQARAMRAGTLNKTKEIEQMRELVHIPSFFPTPRALCAQMTQWAVIEPGALVLEPSAGKGNIAEAAQQRGARVVCVEWNYTLYNILKAKGFETHHADFMQWQPEPAQLFDYVLMNPPFENAKDIDHTRRAFDFVKPGGALIAIISAGAFQNSTRKAREFQQWTDDNGGMYKPLPADTFSKSEHPTNVQTYILTINK